MDEPELRLHRPGRPLLHGLVHHAGIVVKPEAMERAALQGFHAAIGADVFGALTLRGSMTARNVRGGTAPEQVRAQIERHRGRLALAV